MVETRRVRGRTSTFRHDLGRGPTLVCVHGAADNRHAYDGLLHALDGRERYAINLPGRLGTDGPPAQSVAQMEAFLSDFVESEVKEPYVVVGHSLGGAVAIEHALARKSGLLAGVALLATGARLRVHPMILTLFEQGAASGSLPPMPSWVHEEGADPALVEEATRKRELTPVSTGLADWRAADGFDRMEALSDIRVPTLIVGGSQDALTPPKYSEFLASHIPGAEIVLLEGAGHMLVVDRAAEVAALIDSFATRLEHEARQVL